MWVDIVTKITSDVAILVAPQRSRVLVLAPCFQMGGKRNTFPTLNAIYRRANHLRNNCTICHTLDKPQPPWCAYVEGGPTNNITLQWAYIIEKFNQNTPRPQQRDRSEVAADSVQIQQIQPTQQTNVYKMLPQLALRKMVYRPRYKEQKIPEIASCGTQNIGYTLYNFSAFSTLPCASSQACFRQGDASSPLDRYISDSNAYVARNSYVPMFQFPTMGILIFPARSLGFYGCYAIRIGRYVVIWARDIPPFRCVGAASPNHRNTKVTQQGIRTMPCTTCNKPKTKMVG